MLTISSSLPYHVWKETGRNQWEYSIEKGIYMELGALTESGYFESVIIVDGYDLHTSTIGATSLEDAQAQAVVLASAYFRGLADGLDSKPSNL